jgi:hypothetical protein
VDAASVLPAVFSLAGVAVGAAGSIFAAYLATRTTKEKARLERIVALREERKVFLLDYLRAAHKLHDFAAHMWNAEPSVRKLPGNLKQAAELDSELWLQQKKLLLVSRRPLRDASAAWSERLTEATDHPRPEECGFWDFIEPIQSQFIDAARDEIGVVDALAVS